MTSVSLALLSTPRKKPVDKAVVKVALLRSKSARFWSTCFNHTRQNERKQRKIILEKCPCAVTLERISSEHTLQYKITIKVVWCSYGWPKLSAPSQYAHDCLLSVADSIQASIKMADTIFWCVWIKRLQKNRKGTIRKGGRKKGK